MYTYVGFGSPLASQRSSTFSPGLKANSWNSFVVIVGGVESTYTNGQVEQRKQR